MLKRSSIGLEGIRILTSMMTTLQMVWSLNTLSAHDTNNLALIKLHFKRIYYVFAHG